jgi:homocitrate synthase
MLIENPYRYYQPRNLEIIDTTLREGSQTSLLHDHYKYYFNLNDKLEIARALIIYGVKFIELFAPIVSTQELEDFKAIKEMRDELVTQKGYTFLLAHVRCHEDDVASAIEAGFDGLNLYFGTSPQSRGHNHGKSLDEIRRRARQILETVHRDYPHIILRFSGEDAYRTPLSDLFYVYDDIVPLVQRLGIPDTVGVAAPELVAERITRLRQRYPSIDLEGHFHDDRGFALYNAITAVKSGARFINTTILGIGERSGITSMTALLFNLYVDRVYDAMEGYTLRGSYPINVLMASKMRKLVQSKEPVSLTNRTHSAGVHQKAVLEDTVTYEAHPLDLFGVNESEILLGPLSGWNVIFYFLKEIKYFNIDEETAKKITRAFKDQAYNLLADKTPSEVLIDMAVNQFGLKQLEIPEQYRDGVIQHLHEGQAQQLHVREDEGGHSFGETRE